jgi:hypothetical protein
MQLTSPTSKPVVAASAHPVRDDRVFVPQFRSPGLPDGLPFGPGNGNCGPTSIVNALRLVGLDVPGFHGERSQAVIDAARTLVTGALDPGSSTNKHQQAFALRAAGADVHVTRSLPAALDAVRDGAVLLLGGDRAASGWPRRPDDPPRTGVASHAAVVSRFDETTGRYVVLDPALEAPVQVDASQLAAFTQVDDGARMLRLGLLVREPGTSEG